MTPRRAAHSFHRRLKVFGRSLIAIFARAWRRFNEVGAPEGAASMAFFAIFSLFPLLLLLVAVGSVVLQGQEAQQKVFDLVNRTLPVSRKLIERTLRRVLELRSTMGIAGTISLLWSASGFFSTLAYHLNRAWPEAALRSFLKGRLVAIMMVAGLAGLLGLSLTANTVLHLLPRFIPSWGKVLIFGTWAWKRLSDLGPFVFSFFQLWGLYCWVPNTRVRWPEALGGAIAAVLGVEITTAAFIWYLGSGLAGYELVYGSLGTFVALMLWIYLNSLIVLFGGHLSAAIAYQARTSKTPSGKVGVRRSH
jgi:membrane protein